MIKKFNVKYIRVIVVCCPICMPSTRDYTISSGMEYDAIPQLIRKVRETMEH